MISQRVPLLLAVLLVAGIVPRALSQDLPAAERDAGFVALFNGKDFTGWQFNGGPSPPTELPANWKVEDGVIKCTGGGSPHLGSEKAYRDFELRLEWRGVKAPYNSGLYIRSGKKVGSNQLNLAYKSEGNPVGAKLTGAKAAGELQKPAGEWNEWRVIAQGEKLTLYCNDKLAWEATGFTPAEGHIGMQAEGAAMEFRNIRLREIK